MCCGGSGSSSTTPPTYDRRVWDTAVGRLGARAALAGELASWECAMRAFAAYVGERSKRGVYKNQKLPGGDHTALGDARATLRLIERMAEGAFRTKSLQSRGASPHLEQARKS